MSEPDLFVVCKNCSSEVSPYVTECPYCGQRVRKRAPKIEKDGTVEALASPRSRGPSLPRLRRGEMPGIAPDTRPYATLALVGLSLLATLVSSAGVSLASLVVIDAPSGERWWQLLTTPFVHYNLGYQFIALVAVGIFGMHLERRFGLLAPVGIFLASGAAGAGVAAAAAAGLGTYPIAGANGAALGLLCAWLAEDRRANRGGDDRGNDLIGVYVFAAVLALLSLAEPSASPAAAAGGALTGALIGLAASAVRR